MRFKLRDRLDPKTQRRITVGDLGREPFRIFFPLGVVCGVLGVLLWPLFLRGITSFYPGQIHSRLMAYGLFGGFILGFLGTAMPRMLSAPPLGVANVLVLSSLHAGMAASFLFHKILFGDALFLIMLIYFLMLMIRRARHRKDLPPPGFVLVVLAFACAVAGSVLSLVQPFLDESGAYWALLQTRLSYQGFVLFPILGIGPFILPRFFGLSSAHDFPTSLTPSAAWKKKAAFAALAGAVIIGSFFIELTGSITTGHLIRFGAVMLYLAVEFPFRQAPRITTALGASLWVAFACVIGGFGLIAFFPAFRLPLLHLTLIGGFAVITFTVATRVLFGHSGNLDRLKQRNWWLLIAVVLMLLAMATRVSGDFWPKIMASHYVYGAIIWTAAVAVWAWFALRKVTQVGSD